MTLRWRLTLFYTTLLALILLVIGLAVVTVLRNNLTSNARAELLENYSGLGLDRLRALSRIDTVPLPINPDLYFVVDALPGVPDARILSWEQVNFRSDPDPYTVSQNLRPSFSTLPNERPYQLEEREFERLRTTPYIFEYKTLRRYDGTETSTLTLIALFPLNLQTDTTLFDQQVVKSTGVLYLGYDLSAYNTIIRQLQTIVLLVSLIGMALAGVGAYLLAGRALRPLKFVRDAAETISEKTLRRRVPEPDTGDEVQDLAHALNSMLERLEKSFDAQRRFTSDASHELRTPVTAISGHAGYLLRRTNPNPQQAESLTIIKSEADRLSKLIASLLELARSDSGVNPLRRQPILSRLFLDDVSRELRPVAQATGAEIHTSGDEVEFGADPDKLRQVLINLVSNALKAGARNVWLSSSRESDTELLLRVDDDGPGISEEHLGRLFDRFYRVEESRSRDVGGSGLGLAITKAIVDAHEGIIWIESELGKGTTVYVKLPIVRVEMEHGEEVA